MTSRFFDVVVIGRSLGALSTAVLLARRDFRVLVLGQGGRSCDYEFEGMPFRRRAFTMLFDNCPSWRRLLHELAQSPRFRRHVRELDPMFSVVASDRRLELPPDMDLFSREIEREFPEVRQVVEEMYVSVASANAAADQAFERDAIWPPNSLFERLEASRIAATLPYLGAQPRAELLARFPWSHPFRDVVTFPTQFATHLAPGPEGLAPFALARLHGAWTRGLHALDRGEDEISEFLLERIEAHGGVCRLDSRVSALMIRRGKIVGIKEEGDDLPTGAGLVVTDLPGEQLASLAGGQGITARAKRDWPRVTAAVGRFVASMVVDRQGLPEMLPEESLILPERGQLPDPRRPAIHLQRFDRSAPSSPQPPRSLLVAELLLPVRGALTLLEAREAILARLSEVLPFFEEHLVAMDSPYDGLPLWRWHQGTRREVDRVHVRATAPGAEPMQWQWSVEPAGYMDLAGEPLRGPIPGTYLVGTTVLPALGQEGELLAAWSAARLITKTDRGRQRMRRQMWSRTETG